MRAAVVLRVPSLVVGATKARRDSRSRKHGYGADVSTKAFVDLDNDEPTDVCASRPSRRGIIASPLVVAVTCVASELVSPIHSALAEDTRRVLAVGTESSFATINAAVASLVANKANNASPVVIQIALGVYHERVVFPGGLGLVTLEPAPNVNNSPNQITIQHFTQTPYESTVEVSGDTTFVTMKNVTIKHASKSVANNYAVFVNNGGNLTMTGCDVRSDTGTGVAAEGSTLTVQNSTVHDCKSHGIAVYGDLLGEVGSGKIEGCQIAKNGGDGVLLRQGAKGVVIGNTIQDNAGYSIEVFDVREGTVLKNNKWQDEGKKKPAVKFIGGSEADVELADNTFV